MTDLVQNLRRHPLSVPAITTTFVAVLWLAYAAFGWAHGAPFLDRLGAGPKGEPIALRVDLPFPPEAFHLTYFQRVGRIARTDGQTIYLRGVDRRTAGAIARQYWIKDITLWTEKAS